MTTLAHNGHLEITQSTYPTTLVALPFLCFATLAGPLLLLLGILILFCYSYVLGKELLLEVCALVTRLV